MKIKCKLEDKELVLKKNKTQNKTQMNPTVVENTKSKKKKKKWTIPKVISVNFTITK